MHFQIRFWNVIFLETFSELRDYDEVLGKIKPSFDYQVGLSLVLQKKFLSVVSIWMSLQVLRTSIFDQCFLHFWFIQYSSFNEYTKKLGFPWLFHDQSILHLPQFLVFFQGWFTTVNQQIWQAWQICQVLMISKILCSLIWCGYKSCAKDAQLLVNSPFTRKLQFIITSTKFSFSMPLHNNLLQSKLSCFDFIVFVL